jgi:hypothetical protein
MVVTLHDALTLDARRRSADGYMAVRAKAARAGVYDYLGREVDPEGKKFAADQIVKVYRPAEEVFDAASLASFVAKPITDDHPKQAVTAGNWRDHARGAVFGAVKDGDFVGFDLAFMDAALIDQVEAGKRELSNGYACDVAFEDGVAPDGTAYQAVQRKIRGNHVAVVRRGRAGSQCRVADADPEAFALCDANPAALSGFHQEKTVKKITLDGLQVDLSDADAVAAAISKLQDKATTAETALADAVKAHDKALAAKDAEIDDLKAKVVDEATIDARAALKADVLAKAASVLGDKAPEFTGKTVAEIRRMTVSTKLGDASVKDKSDDYVEARFDGLTGDSKPQIQPLGSPRAVTTNDNASVRDLARASQY